MASARSPDFADQLATMQCSQQVRAQVAPTVRRQTWYPQAVSTPGLPLQYGVAFRDTRAGKAYLIWADGGKSMLVESDLKTKRDTKYVWTSAKACELEKSSRATPETPIPSTAGFSDEDLQKTMSAHPWGVIYVWTPYMPLSVDGLKDIKAAVKAKGGFLTVLVDAKAAPDQSKAWADQGKVLSTEMTPVASHELYAREMGLHYPIAFIYKDKFISNRTYVGHKTDDVYQKWIDSELLELKQDLK